MGHHWNEQAFGFGDGNVRLRDRNGLDGSGLAGRGRAVYLAGLFVVSSSG